MGTPGPDDGLRIGVESAGDARSLVLEHRGRCLDLSAFLARRDLPADLVDLAASGWLERGSLLGALDEDGWEPLDPRGSDSRRPTEVPVDPARVGKILALGRNFRAHAQELGQKVPEEPLFFNKLPETLVPHEAVVTVPPWYRRRVDHEAELAVVIGRTGRDVPAERAMEHVAGYTVANDLTARSLQGDDRSRRHPWFRAKNLDGFCPLGPCFVPRDFLDPSDLAVSATVNGEARQQASTKSWIVDVPHAIEHLSRHLTLHPGDLILMGTSAGVGPLEDGDRVVCSIEGIGDLATRIARP